MASGQVLGAYGLSYDAIKAKGGSVKHVPRPATVGAIQDGSADAWMHIVNEGHPVVTELTTVTTVRMLPLSKAAVDKLVADGWAPYTVAPNTFKGQTEPVTTVDGPTNVLASADLPEALAYEVTKLIVENKPKLVQVHAALSDFEPGKAADPLLTGCPLHPGAERYYREKGLIR
jgi:TRAP transporter TAXI family solute receptor